MILVSRERKENCHQGKKTDSYHEKEKSEWNLKKETDK